MSRKIMENNVYCKKNRLLETNKQLGNPVNPKAVGNRSIKNVDIK